MLLRAECVYGRHKYIVRALYYVLMKIKIVSVCMVQCTSSTTGVYIVIKTLRFSLLYSCCVDSELVLVEVSIEFSQLAQT